MLANLNDGTIKYDMKVAVEETRATRGEKTYNIGGYKLPVRCRGQLSAPDCKPDVADIATLLYQKVGKDVLKDALGIKPKTPAATTGGASTESQAAPPPQTTTVQPSTAEPPAGTQPATTTKKKKKKSAAEQLLDQAVKGLTN